MIVVYIIVSLLIGFFSAILFVNLALKDVFKNRK